MNGPLASILEKISTLPPDWHSGGTVSGSVLSGLARHAEQIGPVLRTAETGSGKTTLLFSHISRDHRVFAVDGDNGSVVKAKGSPLLNPGVVTFVEGPTQRTLPKQEFTDPFQIVLLDGPHGYPFPDLEYYYFYPHIQPGGLLVLDDIHIPTIGRMFDIIRAGDMFGLLEVIGTTAFLERTGAPLINPETDGWWEQGYNRAYYERLTGPGVPESADHAERAGGFWSAGFASASRALRTLLSRGRTG